MAKKLFAAADFDKHLSIGDQLVFDKPELKKLRIDLVWAGTDLDICAFLLGSDGLIHDKSDLVYFNSMTRWKTKKDFSDSDFDPTEGRISLWDKEVTNYKNQRKWMEDTLPISLDCSVIGSWDDMSDDDDDSDCGETMHVLLDEIDSRKYSTIIFAAAVAKDRIAKGETFEDAHDPIVNIYNAETDEQIADYKLASQFPGKDVVCFGKIEYDANSVQWSFSPLGDAYTGGMMHLATEVFN